MFDNSNILKKDNSSYVSNYIINEAMSLTPTEVILKLYDFAILNLKKNEPQKSLRAITELMVSLNFDYKEISIGLYSLYRYCRDQIIAGKYNSATYILQGLRDTWAKAFNL